MTAQPGIFAAGNSEHCYVEVDLLPGGTALELATGFAALHAHDTPLVAASCVVGLRPELWAEIAPGAAPVGVRSFAQIAGPEFTMPATQHDGWLWLAGARRDAVYENTVAALASLDGIATVASEITAWSHLLNRDLIGFIDGTENPAVAEAPQVACQVEGPAAGSSVLLFQQWEHSPTWARLSVEEQERVIGRRKADSEELPEELMPADSHVSRNVVEEDGRELAIFRRNTAWGGPARHGTVFVGFCAEQHPLQVMLERMAGLPDGIRDALTRHTVALSGAYYVVPSLDALAGLLPEEG